MTQKSTLLFFRRALSWINFSLSFFNWIVIPSKLILFLTLSLITKLLEPFKKAPIVPAIHKGSLTRKANEWAEQLENHFSYKEFILPYITGDIPTGTNHDRGDWCLWNGVYLAYLCYQYKRTQNSRLYEDIKFRARQYVDHWIDNSGYLCRGWCWNEDKQEKEYRISGDQITGFVYGLSLVPQDILQNYCCDKIHLFVDNIIKDNYVINDPEEGRTYWRDYRLGIMAYGQSVPTILSLLLLAHKSTGWDRYLKEYNKFVDRGALLYLFAPIPKLFEWIDDFAYNVTLMSLCAFDNLCEHKFSKIGIRFTWWINRFIYNPFWNFLCHFHTNNFPQEDFEIALFQLSTVGSNNLTDYYVDNTEYQPQFAGYAIPIRKYFWIVGKKVTLLPPPFNDKLSDVFMFQRIEREISQYGNRTLETRTDEKYNMIFYLICYELYRLLDKEGSQDIIDE